MDELERIEIAARMEAARRLDERLVERYPMRPLLVGEAPSQVGEGWPALTGRAGDLPRRVARHRAGNGSKLLAAVGRAGIGWRVVRFWPGADRRRERQLHKAKCSPRLCPSCRERAGMLR